MYDARWPQTASELLKAGYTWPQTLWALGLTDNEGHLLPNNDDHQPL